MSNWSKNSSEEREALVEVNKNWAPKKITDQEDLQRSLQDIEMNQAMNVVDKMKAKRQLFKSVFEAKQMELRHNMESYRNYLLARRDVEAKAITLEASKAITIIEGQFFTMMDEIGLVQDSKHMDTLRKAGEMYTTKLSELDDSPMLPQLKVQLQKQYQDIYDKTVARINGSLDEYIDELRRRDGRR